MLGFISKKKLLKTLEELGSLADLSDPYDLPLPGMDDLSFRCGVANAVNISASSSSSTTLYEGENGNDQT